MSLIRASRRTFPAYASGTRPAHPLLRSLLLPLLLLAAPAAAQDTNVLHSIEEIEARLMEEPLPVVDMAQARPQIAGDRSARVVLAGPTGEAAIRAKWKPVARGGQGFNNEPRYELAAYRLQKLFLDEPDYVVPPVVLRSMRLEEYEELRPGARPTLPNTSSVLFLLSYWLENVTNLEPFQETLFRLDPVYARHWGNLNLLTHMIDHKDENVGNILISLDVANRRVFSVDNDVAFRSEASDRGDRWRRLQVDRLPAATVERLRSLTREDLEATLGVVAEFQRVGDHLVPARPGPNLDPGRGVRVRDGRVQFGLTSREIRDLERRIERLLQDVDRGRLATF